MANVLQKQYFTNAIVMVNAEASRKEQVSLNWHFYKSRVKVLIKLVNFSKSYATKPTWKTFSELGAYPQFH